MNVSDLIKELRGLIFLTHRPGPMPIGVERVDLKALGEAIQAMPEICPAGMSAERALLVLLTKCEELERGDPFFNRALGGETLVYLLGFSANLLEISSGPYDLHTILMLRREIKERWENDFQPDEVGYEAMVLGIANLQEIAQQITQGAEGAYPESARLQQED